MRQDNAQELGLGRQAFLLRKILATLQFDQDRHSEMRNGRNGLHRSAGTSLSILSWISLAPTNEPDSSMTQGRMICNPTTQFPDISLC